MGNNCQTNCYDQKELNGGEFNKGDKFAMAENEPGKIFPLKNFQKNLS